MHNRKIHFFIVKNKKDKYSYVVSFIKNYKRLNIYYVEIKKYYK